jgi:DNA-binding GntR family transcriptional regulator
MNVPPEVFTAPAGRMKRHAYDELKRRILDEVYPTGSFLAERKLAADLGMSKTPVKAALERLEAEGFVTVSPQQGIIVRELSPEEIADQYEIRVALETHVLRSVAGKLTPALADRVKANLKAQEEVRGTDDLHRGMVLDAEFHALFVEFLGNREIIRVMGQLRERMRRVITKAYRLKADRFEKSVSEHAGIARAVLRGDGQRAAKLLEDHLERGRQLVLSPRRG